MVLRGHKRQFARLLTKLLGSSYLKLLEQHGCPGFAWRLAVVIPSHCSKLEPLCHKSLRRLWMSNRKAWPQSTLETRYKDLPFNVILPITYEHFRDFYVHVASQLKSSITYSRYNVWHFAGLWGYVTGASSVTGFFSSVVFVHFILASNLESQWQPRRNSFQSAGDKFSKFARSSKVKYVNFVARKTWWHPNMKPTKANGAPGAEYLTVCLIVEFELQHFATFVENWSKNIAYFRLDIGENTLCDNRA